MSALNCPLCDDISASATKSLLRIHLYQHYKPTWDDRVSGIIGPADLKADCDVCNKKLTGVTNSGLKGTLICHWAIQHDELRERLVGDPKIEDDFVEKLYGKDGGNKTTEKPCTSLKDKAGIDSLKVFDSSFEVNSAQLRRGNRKRRKNSDSEVQIKRLPVVRTEEVAYSEDNLKSEVENGIEVKCEIGNTTNTDIEDIGGFGLILPPSPQKKENDDDPSKVLAISDGPSEKAAEDISPDNQEEKSCLPDNKEEVNEEREEIESELTSESESKISAKEKQTTLEEAKKHLTRESPKKTKKDSKLSAPVVASRPKRASASRCAASIKSWTA